MKIYEPHKELVKMNDKENEYIGTLEKGEMRINKDGKEVACRSTGEFMRLRNIKFDYIFDVNSNHYKNGSFLCPQLNSIAHYIIYDLKQPLEKYWSSKNILDPWFTPKGGNKHKVYMLCQNPEAPYHNDEGGYEVSCDNFSGKNSRCSYCSSKKIHYKDSFGYYIENELGIKLEEIWNYELNHPINPFEIAKCSGIHEVFLYCLKKPYHNYDIDGNKIGYKIKCSKFFTDHGCSYCHPAGNIPKVHYKDSIWYNYPEVAKSLCDKDGNPIDEEILKNTSCSSHERFHTKCKYCNEISKKDKAVSMLVGHGITCDCNKREDYYVYTWIRKDLEQVFYIGKGIGDRWNENHGRSIDFLTLKGNAYCDKVAENLSNSDACILENELINKYVFEFGYSIDIDGYRTSNINQGKHLVNKKFEGILSIYL